MRDLLQKRMSGSEESPTRSSQRDREISDSESYDRRSSEKSSDVKNEREDILIW